MQKLSFDWLKKASPGFLLFVATLSVALFYVGFTVGELTGKRSVVPEGEAHVDTQADQGDESTTIDFKTYWDVWNRIRDSYVHQPVSEQDLFYGSLKGMVDSVGDPYTTYFDPKTAESFNQELSGTFFGIGAEIGEKDEGIIVVAPIADGPAERGGVRAGDQIIAIDTLTTDGMNVNDAVLKIRGALGTQVVLTLFTEGDTETHDITLTREEIKTDSVTWEIRDDNIAVVEIHMFNEDTTTLFEKATQEMLEKNVKGIVLDLRNDPGGLLDQAINVAGFWVDGQTVVIEKNQDGQRPFVSGHGARLVGIPTAVLVNGGSASAAEILSGALQDYKVATIIGEQTFGKGSVQQYYEYEDGSAVKITIAEWLTPLGRSINKVGITPDQIVPFTEEDFHAGKTPQLDAAIAELAKH
jgi:carboxyl-terminal processing protease